jgi:3-hydroxybutyryl-CoA dehydrogenase
VSQPNTQGAERPAGEEVVGLGIVGSGAIACGLARLAAERCEVVVWARSESSAERASTLIEDAGQVVTEMEALRESSVVVEAVAEDLRVKSELHDLLGEILPREVLVSTTTSSLSVQALAEASGRPDRFAAVHFFNPVEKMALVELCFPEQAAEDTRRRFHGLCAQLGKTVVEVPDSAGFVVNRLLFPYLFDAVSFLERSGIEPERVDSCMKLGAGHPMGPLALLDFVGLDVAATIGANIGAQVPQRVRDLIVEGRLGRKTGAGFYEYE